MIDATAEYLSSEDAMAGLQRDLASIDEDEVDAVVLIALHGADLSINSVGSAHLVYTALKHAIAQLEQIIGAPH